MKRLFLIPAAAAFLWSCSTSNSGIQELAGALESADSTFSPVMALGAVDSISKTRDDLSPRDLALLQGITVEIVNRLVDCDSADAAARGMTLWKENYRYMMARDSAAMASAMAEMASANPLLEATRVDSIYTRGLDQLKALERAVGRLKR